MFILSARSRCCYGLVFTFSLLALSLLSRTSRGGFSPDTEMSITSHARVYSRSLPTSILWPLFLAYIFGHTIYPSLASNHAISYRVRSTNGNILRSVARHTPTVHKFSEHQRRTMTCLLCSCFSPKTHSPCHVPAYQTLDFPMTMRTCTQLESYRHGILFAGQAS